MKKNCAFQYYDGYNVKVDKSNLTLDEAKKLWNENYNNMVKNTKEGAEIETAIWINMKDDSDYIETLIHLSSPNESDGQLWEKKFYDKL